MKRPNNESIYLSGTEVRGRYGISAATLWRWEKDPDVSFPEPMKIRGRKFYRVTDLEGWERTRETRAAS